MVAACTKVNSADTAVNETQCVEAVEARLGVGNSALELSKAYVCSNIFCKAGEFADVCNKCAGDGLACDTESQSCQDDGQCSLIGNDAPRTGAAFALLLASTSALLLQAC